MKKTPVLLLTLLLFLGFVAAHGGTSDAEESRNVRMDLGDLSEPASIALLSVPLILGALYVFKRDFMVDDFEKLLILGIFWTALGAISDLYNHHNGAPLNFFTVEHGVMYSGVLFMVSVIGLNLYRARRDGKSMLGYIPEGYEIAVYSPIIIVLSGIGDMLWHEAFGVETQTAAQGLSPTHLMIWIAGMMTVASPLVHYLKSEKREKRFRKLLPELSSAAFILTGLGIIANHFHPYVDVYSSLSYSTQALTTSNQLLGVIGVNINSTMIVALLLFLEKEISLPSGGTFYILTIYTVFMSFITPNPIFIALGTAHAAFVELLRSYYVPREMLFALITASSLSLGYFVTVELWRGITWTVHVWTGTMMLSGVFGILLSVLVFGLD